jgi:predicted ATPase/DNA-binding CsgD family transcriptional regulator
MYATLPAVLPSFVRTVSPLPPTATPCLGREAEAAAILRRLLDDGVRLLTLIGPAGAGKTRLAIHVASLLAAQDADVSWVDLTAIDSSAAVLPFIRQRAMPDTADAAATEGRARAQPSQRLLLIIDNFEHVLAAADDVGRLLTSTPHLTIMVTSRSALRVPGEQLFPVAPLGLPAAGDATPADSPAVALFVQRVQALRPEFQLTPENGADVAEVVTYLDGIPLLIEFAAAQCAVLTPRALLPLLQQPLDLLASRWVGVPARQQSPRQAWDWSYRLLGEAERVLLHRLAVFVDGATLDAIAAISQHGELPGTPPRRPSADLLHALAGLVDQSMIQRADDIQGEPRFRLLRIARAYVQARWDAADDLDALHRRHAEYYLALAERANAEIHQQQVSSWVSRPDQEAGSPRGRWLERIDQDMGNMRAAHRRFCADPADVEQRLRLATALDAYWSHRGELAEGRRWLEEALAASRDGSVAGQHRANALYVAGKLAEHQGDYAAARAFLTEAITLLRAIGDQLRLADALSWNACVSFDVGAEADRRGIEESLAIYQALGDTPGVAKALNFLGEQARLAGDYDRAAQFYQQSLAKYEQGNNPSAMAVIRHNLGYIAQHQQDYARAAALFSDALALYREYGDRRLLVICLAALAAVATTGRPERAVQLFAAAEAHLEAWGTGMQPADLAQHQRNVAAMREAMDEQAFQQAWARGRTMSLDDALALVQETAPADPSLAPAGVHRPAAPAAEQITAREREVADLIARGLTNRQIALRLVIAERTVDKHVGNMLAKLGFASRAQIAAWAVTDGPG